MSAPSSGPGPSSPSVLLDCTPNTTHIVCLGGDSIRRSAGETVRLGVTNSQRSITVSVGVDDVHKLCVAGI